MADEVKVNHIGSTRVCGQCGTANRTHGDRCMICHTKFVAKTPATGPRIRAWFSRLPPLVTDAEAATAKGEGSNSPGFTRGRRIALALGLLALGSYLLPWWIGSLFWGSGKSYVRPYQVAASFFADKAPQYTLGATVVLAIAGLVLVSMWRGIWAIAAGLALVIGLPLLGYWSSASMRSSFQHSARSAYEYGPVPQSAVTSHCSVPPLRWPESTKRGTYQWSALLSGDCTAVVVFRGWAKAMVWSAGRGRQFLSLGRYDSGTLVAFTGRPRHDGDTVTGVSENDWRRVKWRTHACAASRYNEIVDVSFAGQTGSSGNVTSIKGGATRYVIVECVDRNFFLDPETGHVLEVLRR